MAVGQSVPAATAVQRGAPPDRAGAIETTELQLLVGPAVPEDNSAMLTPLKPSTADSPAEAQALEAPSNCEDLSDWKPPPARPGDLALDGRQPEPHHSSA